MSGAARVIRRVDPIAGRLVGGGQKAPAAAPAAPVGPDPAIAAKAAADAKALKAKNDAATAEAERLQAERTGDLRGREDQMRSQTRAAGGVLTENEAGALQFNPVRAKRKSATRTLLG